MKTAAIICEYNPFHNGHRYQIDTARKLTNCDAVVGLMSGNYVQRGEFSIFPKEIRAKACLDNGIDLVLENPAYLTLRSAEGYAFSAVNILNSMGNIGYLVFGGECDDIDALLKVARILCDEPEEFRVCIAKEMEKGVSFPVARERATERVLGKDLSKLLSTPNNLLGVEYLKALIKLKSDIKPVVVKRKGADHNADTPVGDIASATNIRANLCDGEGIDAFIPQNIRELYKKTFVYKKADLAILSAITLMSVEKIKNLPDISEGLENKVKTEALQADTLEELIANVKSKRYAYSRIKRALLCGYLGIDKEEAKKQAEYIKIYDFNENGQKVLNSAKKTAKLPLAKNAAAIMKNPSAMAQWKKELYRDKVYQLMNAGDEI